MNFKNIIIIATSFLFGLNQLQLNEQTVIDFELSNSLVHKVNMKIGSIDFKESKYFSLTPQKKADGSWKNKKKVYFIEFI